MTRHDTGDGDLCPVPGHGRMFVLAHGQWCPHQSHDRLPGPAVIDAGQTEASDVPSDGHAPGLTGSGPDPSPAVPGRGDGAGALLLWEG